MSSNFKDYVTYEQAQKLKELGFDMGCNAFYEVNPNKTPYLVISAFPFVQQKELSDESAAAPTLEQAAKWLRAQGWHIQIATECSTFIRYLVRLSELVDNGEVADIEKTFPSYEEALSAGIDYVLNLLTEKEGNELA